MTQLPEAFTEYTRRLMGEERYRRYLASFDEDAPVSIRLNPQKTAGMTVVGGQPVPWCRGGYYLASRPNFTMDPLLHAGCYYVQEAASMFLDEVVRQVVVQSSEFRVHSSLKCLDLCAAPGGKSTLLRAALPADSVLYSNEPVRNRASILSENVWKWGYANHFVTNLYPRDYLRSKMTFDLIVCDVPCSGEGMFRKDEATIKEWSPQNVEKCWQLQREIVSDAWACLSEGGLLIYSTCTFNTKENEENVRYFLETYDDMEVVPIKTQPEWHVTGSLLDGFDEPVYRFIPGTTHSEGLFVCVVKKRGERYNERGERLEVRGKRNDHRQNEKALTILSPLTSHLSPLTSHLSPLTSHHSPQRIDLSYQQAISYLRGEALQLPPEAPRGELTVSFEGHALGPVKNIGMRANNLYPKPWRIRTTHTPDEYEPILIKI